MAMHGSLKDMTVADIIQHNCQDGKTALLSVDHAGKRAQIYIKDGAVVHAVMGIEAGEDVVYETLAWEEGKFVLELGVLPPLITIKRSWSSLLLEGAKRLDESGQDDGQSGDKATRNRDATIREILNSFLTSSQLFKAIAVTDLNGHMYTSPADESLDHEVITAIATATQSFGRRSLTTLSLGGFQYMLLHGETGCQVIAQINAHTLFVGVADPNPDMQKMTDQVNAVSTHLNEYLA